MLAVALQQAVEFGIAKRGVVIPWWIHGRGYARKISIPSPDLMRLHGRDGYCLSQKDLRSALHGASRSFRHACAQTAVTIHPRRFPSLDILTPHYSLFPFRLILPYDTDCLRHLIIVASPGTSMDGLQSASAYNLTDASFPTNMEDLRPKVFPDRYGKIHTIHGEPLAFAPEIDWNMKDNLAIGNG